MYETLILGIVACCAGCAYTSYKIGLREGAENMLNLLQQQKIIAYTNKGNIKPNPFFVPNEEDWKRF